MKRLITDKQLKEKLGGCSDMTIWRLVFFGFGHMHPAGLEPASSRVGGVCSSS